MQNQSCSPKGNRIVMYIFRILGLLLSFISEIMVIVAPHFFVSLFEEFSGLGVFVSLLPFLGIVLYLLSMHGVKKDNIANTNLWFWLLTANVFLVYFIQFSCEKNEVYFAGFLDFSGLSGAIAQITACLECVLFNLGLFISCVISLFSSTEEGSIKPAKDIPVNPKKNHTCLAIRESIFTLLFAEFLFVKAFIGSDIALFLCIVGFLLYGFIAFGSFHFQLNTNTQKCFFVFALLFVILLLGIAFSPIGQLSSIIIQVVLLLLVNQKLILDCIVINVILFFLCLHDWTVRVLKKRGRH